MSAFPEADARAARNGRATQAVAAIFARTWPAGFGPEAGSGAPAILLNVPLSRAWCRRLSGVDDAPVLAGR